MLFSAVDVVSGLAAVMASAAEGTATMQALVTSYKEACDRQIAELKEFKARDAEYRQDSADLLAANERLELDLVELMSVVNTLAPAVVHAKIPGPTDEVGVAEALQDGTVRMAEVVMFWQPLKCPALRLNYIVIQLPSVHCELDGLGASSGLFEGCHDGLYA